MATLDFPAEPSAHLEAILGWAVRERATDIHLSPLAEGGVVRVRIDGLLRDLEPLEPGLFLKVTSRVKVLAEMDIAEKRRPQDGRVSRVLSDRPIDFRVSSIPALHGESLVLRVLDRTSGVRTLEQLGLPSKEE